MKKAKPFLILVIFFALLGCSLSRRQPGREEELPPSQAEGRETLSFSEDHPYVTLTPRADGHALSLSISRFGESRRVEYELIYETGPQLQGAIGRFDLPLAIPEEILFGTCSRGVCKYDEDVEKGSLRLNFFDPDNPKEKTWEADFRLQKLDPKGGKVSSSDGKFTLDLPAGAVKSSSFVVIMPLLGLPESFGKKIVGEPYGVFTLAAAKVKNAAASFLFFSTPGNFENLAIFGWDGKNWVEYETTVDLSQKKLTAKVDRLTAFVVAQRF